MFPPKEPLPADGKGLPRGGLGGTKDPEGHRPGGGCALARARTLGPLPEPVATSRGLATMGPLIAAFRLFCPSIRERMCWSGFWGLCRAENLFL